MANAKSGGSFALLALLQKKRRSIENMESLVEEEKRTQPDYGRAGLLSLLKDLKTKKRGGTEVQKSHENQNGANVSGEGPKKEEVKSAKQDVNDELKKKVLRQIEYYFGDYNLPRDKFLLGILEENDGWIDMDTMMTFKRLSALTKDQDLVLKILDEGSKLMQVDMETRMIRRDPRRILPEMNEERRMELQNRTVFVNGFDRNNTTLDDLINFFETGFEKVCNIRMRTSRPPADSDEPPRFLGSAFVTFLSKDAAERFIRDNKNQLTFQDRKLTIKWQREFFAHRLEYNDSLDLATLDRTVWVHGFDRTDTSQEALLEFFGDFKGASSVKKRVFRGSADEEWKFTGSVCLTFDTVADAKAFMELKRVEYNGDGLKRKWLKEFYQEKKLFKKELGVE